MCGAEVHALACLPFDLIFVKEQAFSFYVIVTCSETK